MCSDQEGRTTYHIKGGDAEEPLGVVDALLLENLGCDGDSGIDWVGNNVQDGLHRTHSHMNNACNT